MSELKKAPTSRKEMSLRSEYDTWHLGIHEADPEHDDASSPWHELVREYLGGVAGLSILEVACGRGGFVRELARRRPGHGVRFFVCSGAGSG